MKSIITKGRNYTVWVGDANADFPNLGFLRHKVKYIKSTCSEFLCLGST